MAGIESNNFYIWKRFELFLDVTVDSDGHLMLSFPVN